MFISELIDNLIKYKKQYGDVPCFIADSTSPSAMQPVHSTFIATVSTNNAVSTLPWQNYGTVKMNIAVISNAFCDSEEPKTEDETEDKEVDEDWDMK